MPPKSPRSLSSRVPRRNVSGFGLVEILVGITIGLLALLIVYQVLSLSEGYRRTTTAGGDAQSAGMISSYLMAADIAASGDTVSNSGSELGVCPADPNPDPILAFQNTWRPIPVLIVDGGDDVTSDSFAVFSGTNRRLVTPLDLANDYVPGGSIVVQSPLGFHGSADGEAAHMFVIADLAAGNCEVATVGNWGGPLDVWRRRAPVFNDLTGFVTITPAAALTNPYPQGSSWLMNLGPGDRVRKVFYDVDNGCAGCMPAGVLRVQDLIVPGAVPNPIASNIVLLKAQYGIDTSVPPDNFIDTWVNARNPPWDAASVLAAPLAQLKQIKAVRFALIVRSTQFERVRDAEGRDAVGAGTASGTDVNLANNFTTTLFNCNGLAPCTGEMPNIVIPGTSNYRYRVFEQVVPLTNQIWNP